MATVIYTNIIRHYNERKHKTNLKLKNINSYIIVFILINLIKISAGDLNNTKNNPDFTKTSERGMTNKLIDDAKSYKYKNDTFRTGNELWDNILNQCSLKPSISCLQKNVFKYLDESLGNNGDVNITSGFCLKKNRVDYNKYSSEANVLYKSGNPTDVLDDDYNEVDEESRGDKNVEMQWESETPLEEVTDALYDKSINFMMTHDMNLRLPETMFHGATLKLSPRALTKTGALLHVEILPKKNDVGDGRIFFKKIKRFFKKKLVMAALATVLVVALIKLKLFFVLPLLLGVGAAKKLFLKFLLFLFPALSHIFKLCSWYHQSYHVPKYHHHHHLVSHHHHKVPVVLPHPPSGSSHHHHSSHSAPSTIYGPPGPPASIYGPPGPPSGAHVYSHPETSHGGDYATDWELSGPGLGSEYIGSIHRNSIATFKPQLDDINEINAWGLGLPPGSVNQHAADGPGLVATGNSYSEVRVKPNIPIGRPVGPPGSPSIRFSRPVAKDLSLLQAEKDALLRAAQLANKAPPSSVRDELLRVTHAQLHEKHRVRMEQKLIEQQQKILAEEDEETKHADKYYGALIERVEKTLATIGATDNGCRERAVCSLYKDPIKHTPHSNLVSNELSKDSSELPPAGSSKAALRYYKYVQAARDGQEQNNCLISYPYCSIDYKKK